MLADSDDDLVVKCDNKLVVITWGKYFNGTTVHRLLPPNCLVNNGGFYIDFIFILKYRYLKNIVTVNLDISHTQTILPRPDEFGYYLILLNSQNTWAIKLLAIWPTSFLTRTISKARYQFNQENNQHEELN